MAIQNDRDFMTEPHNGLPQSLADAPASGRSYTNDKRQSLEHWRDKVNRIRIESQTEGSKNN